MNDYHRQHEEKYSGMIGSEYITWIRHKAEVHIDG